MDLEDCGQGLAERGFVGWLNEAADCVVAAIGDDEVFGWDEDVVVAGVGLFVAEDMGYCAVVGADFEDLDRVVGRADVDELSVDRDVPSKRAEAASWMIACPCASLSLEN